jgi:DUF1365 family protein
MKVVTAICRKALRLWLKGGRPVPRQRAASDTGLAAAKGNDYTSRALSARAED